MDAWGWRLLCFLSLWGRGWGQLRYSVPEESQLGTFVGNVARDLGLEPAAVSERRLRLGSDSSTRYFTVNLDNGDLTVNERIDREAVCGASTSCLLAGEVVIENPLEVFRLEVEIQDINDNAPSFGSTESVVEISEFTVVGSRFPLERSLDPDTGINTVRDYKLSTNQHFSLNVKKFKDGKVLPTLILEKPLDRESQVEHHLTLTAIDGGNPERSGTTRIAVHVVDNNDNAPAFDQSVYRVKLKENLPVGTVLTTLNATDLDEGLNGEIEYSFEEDTPDSIQSLFLLDTLTGEIRVEGVVDFEESQFFEFHIRAKDKGVPRLVGSCIVQVEVEDENDNTPEVHVTSMATSVPENTPVGTAVGVFRVRDGDSGKNGEVRVQIPNLPFKIKSNQNHYSLITDGILDRESVSQYIIQLTVTDLGYPPLYSQKTIIFNISDINDNPPCFLQSSFYAHVKENNHPGSLLYTVSASDLDEGENALLAYSIMESQIEGSPISSFVYINPQNGNLYSQRSFDYELVQVLQITVLVEDSGSPKLSSSATVIIYISDENDNSPVVIHPLPSKELTMDQKIPRSFPIGYLVTKVTAVDADSGHNAWVSYSILLCTEPCLFRISSYTGELRTARGYQEKDNLTQQLLILAKDNGEPSLSTTVTILLSAEENAIGEGHKAQEVHKTPEDKADMTLYLIIALVAVSAVALVTFIILSVRCIMKGNANGSICCFPGEAAPMDFSELPQPTLHLNADGTLRYAQVNVRSTDPQSQCYQTYLTPVSDRGEFTFTKPLNFPELTDLVNEADPLVPGLDVLSEPNQVR